MLIVADSSPFHLLIEIGQAAILPALFTDVVVPPQVVAELRHPHAPEIVRVYIESPPSWMKVHSPTHVTEFPRLDEGECAAISLASELNADFLLIDERLGRQVANAQGLTVIGTIGILERAAEERLVDLRSSFEAVRRTRFHVSQKLLDEVLKRHEGSKPR